MLSESTIYRRHERRRLRTLANIDDPRPAPVRVLAGLPIIGDLVGKYIPDTEYKAEGNGINLDQPGTFSEETIFLGAGAPHHAPASVSTPDRSKALLLGLCAGASFAWQSSRTRPNQPQSKVMRGEMALLTDSIVGPSMYSLQRSIFRRSVPIVLLPCAFVTAVWSNRK